MFRSIVRFIRGLFGYSGGGVTVQPTNPSQAIDLEHLRELAGEAQRLINLLIASRVPGVLETHDPLMAYAKTQEFDPQGAVTELLAFLKDKQGPVYTPAPGANQLSYFVWTFAANAGYGTPDWVSYEQIRASSVQDLVDRWVALMPELYPANQRDIDNSIQVILERIDMIFSRPVAWELLGSILGEFEASKRAAPQNVTVAN